jgi:hypothetical protein
MQRETTPSFSPTIETQHAYAVVSPQEATWRQLLPVHRLAVIAKTPITVAMGVYMSGGRFATPAVILTMLATGALWAVLYAINEATDLRLEHHVPVPRAMRLLLSALCIGVCVVAALVSPALGGLCTAMALGQMAYCVPPVRLKRHWWAVLLLSGMLNPVLRLECGALWGVHAIPPLAYFAFVTLHLGAAIRSRVLLRERDRKLAYRVAPPRMEWVGMACTGVGMLGTYGLCWQGVLPRVFLGFTTVAALFSLYAWSGRVSSVSRLRQGWLGFAILALLAYAILYLNRT